MATITIHSSHKLQRNKIEETMRAPSTFLFLLVQGSALTVGTLSEAPSAPLKDAIHRSLSVISNHKCMNQMQHIFEELDILLLDSPLVEEVGGGLGNEFIVGGTSPLIIENFDDSFFSGNCMVSMESSSIVCNLKDYIFDLAPQCSTVGGDPVALNAKFICHDSEVMQLKNIPFCIGQSCDESLITFLNDIVNSSEEMQTNTCSIRLTASQKGDGCFESYTSNRFSVLVGDQVRSKTCKWLQKKRSPKSRKRFCQNTEVRDACPLTCCTCRNERKLLFLRKFKKGKDGEGEEHILKRCGWLESKSEKVKNRYCSRRRTAVNGYEPAWKQCPNTCGFCSAEQ